MSQRIQHHQTSFLHDTPLQQQQQQQQQAQQQQQQHPITHVAPKDTQRQPPPQHQQQQVVQPQQVVTQHQPQASGSTTTVPVVAKGDWTKDLVHLAKTAELKKHALTLQLHTAHILSAHATLEQQGKAIQDLREQKNKLESERTRLLNCLREINEDRDKVDLMKASLDKECNDTRAKIKQLTDGDYAIAKADVDRLRQELGQPPLPSLQNTLEEKTAQYLNERQLNGNESQVASVSQNTPSTPIANVNNNKRSAPPATPSSEGQAKRPRGRPKGSKNKNKVSDSGLLPFRPPSSSVSTSSAQDLTANCPYQHHSQYPSSQNPYPHSPTSVFSVPTTSHAHSFSLTTAPCPFSLTSRMRLSSAFALLSPSPSIQKERERCCLRTQRRRQPGPREDMFELASPAPSREGPRLGQAGRFSFSDDGNVEPGPSNSRESRSRSTRIPLGRSGSQTRITNVYVNCQCRDPDQGASLLNRIGSVKFLGHELARWQYGA